MGSEEELFLLVSVATNENAGALNKPGVFFSLVRFGAYCFPADVAAAAAAARVVGKWVA